MRCVVACALVLAACGDDPPDAVFGFAGTIADNPEHVSTIGLWVVASADPPYYYKLGDGSSVVGQFDIAFRIEPPREARNTGEFGVALVAGLPGIATVGEGVVNPRDLVIVGLTEDHAVIFKRPGATGPAWLATFPDGFACGLCVRASDGGLDGFEPVSCSAVVLERVFPTPCAWY